MSDSATARAVRVSRYDVAGPVISFLWMCLIVLENDLDKKCAAKISFPQKYLCNKVELEVQYKIF